MPNDTSFPVTLASTRGLASNATLFGADILPRLAVEIPSLEKSVRGVGGRGVFIAIITLIRTPGSILPCTYFFKGCIVNVVSSSTLAVNISLRFYDCVIHYNMNLCCRRVSPARTQNRDEVVSVMRSFGPHGSVWEMMSNLRKI